MSTIGVKQSINPPGWFLVASERMNTKSEESAFVILILSPRRAPPLLGEDGSTARTATDSPRPIHTSIIFPIRDDFPTPGGPVIPKDEPIPLSIGEL